MRQPIIRTAESLLLCNYERYYRLAYAYVKTEEDALDVVQESAYKVMANCGKVKREEYLETWIYRIVINTAKDALRRPCGNRAARAITLWNPPTASCGMTGNTYPSA